MYRVTIYNGDTATIIHEPTTDPMQPHLYSGKLVQGVSGEIDTLSFEILPNNPGYELLNSRTTMVSVVNTKTNTAEFQGRVLTVTPQMDSNGLVYKSAVCEDRLGYLCDSVQPYAEKATYTLTDFFTLLLGNHNAQVEDYKKIYPGTISVTAAASTGNVTKGLNYQTTWEAINEKLLDTEGGEIQLYTGPDGLLYLDYVDELGSRGEQTIKLGVNMKSISQEIDPTSVITRLIPLGAVLESKGETINVEERLTIADVNGGCIYLDDTDAQDVYGIVVGTVTWDDVTEASNLLTKGKNWLANQTVTDQITLSAVDLSQLGLAEDAIERYNYYRIINAGIGLDAFFRVVKRTADICDPSNITYKMGSQDKSLAAVLTDASGKAGSAATDAAAAINAELSKTVTSLIAGNATIIDLTAKVATIESAYISEATVEILLSDYIKTENLDAAIANLGYATIEYLDANYAKITILESAVANIDTLLADVANISTILAGSVGTGKLQSIHITSDNVVIDDAVITSAMIASLSASKLTAGTIYTDNIKIANNSGENMLIDGATIQINDGATVRVQIGEDGNGDYNLYLWDADGNLLWNAQGLTEAGVSGNGGIIKDAAIADDANINESKIDMDSVARRLNDDGSITVDASRVKIDDSTLDVAYTTITKSISNNAEKTETLETSLTVVQGQIDAKIWQSDITAAKDELGAEITTLTDNYTTLSADVNGISSKVGTMETSVSEIQSDAVASETVYYAMGYTPDAPPSDPTTEDTSTAPIVGIAEVGNTTLGVIGWSTTQPEPAEGGYIWTATLLTYLDGSTAWTTPTLLTDDYTRTKITSVETSFEQTAEAIKASVESLQSTSTTQESRLTSLELTVDGVKSTVSTLETSVSNSLSSVSILYALGDSSTAAPTSGWSSTAPEWVNGKYMWQKTITTKSNGGSEETVTCISGATGATGAAGAAGADGADGVGISSIVPQYYLSTSNTACEGGKWTEEQPEWQSGYYLWTRSYITWDDGSTSATTPVLAGAINSANEKIVEVETNLEQTAEKITASVTVLETTSDTTTQTLADLTVALGELQTYVDTSITSADESIRQELSSLISQTAAQVEATFTQVNSRIDTVDGDLTEAIEEIQSYIRLSGDGVEIGKSDSAYTALLSNDRLEFRESGVVVAYISNSKMYISTLEVTESARLTCFEFRQRSNGHGIIRYKKLTT